MTQLNYVVTFVAVYEINKNLICFNSFLFLFFFMLINFFFFVYFIINGLSVFFEWEIISFNSISIVISILLD